MNVNEVLKTLEEYAPLELSDKLVALMGGYDNSGIIAQVSGDITGIVFTLDLTDASVQKAVETGCNLIVTHHPAIYAPIKNLNYDASPLLKCLNAGIGVISMHLNLDCAVFGIDYYLAKGLGAMEQKIVYQTGDGCGYGRVFESGLALCDIKERYEKEFLTDKVMTFGNPNRAIEKIASFCGSGLDESELEKVPDVDLYVSSDIKHHVILSALKKGKCVMQVTHYSSEMYGFREFCKSVKQKFGKLKSYIVENDYML